MLEKIISGGIGRAVRTALNAVLSHLVLIPLGKALVVPAVANFPGLPDLIVKALDTFSNPAFAEQAAAMLALFLTALLSGFFKSMRDKGKVPSWLPL